MTFKAYRSVATNHTHENIAFDRLHNILETQWAQKEEPLHLIGNVFVNGQEIDAIVLKRNALIVIDFKNYGGDLSFSENGSWRIDGQTVKGGSKANPYQQIRDNKFSVLNYLNRHIKFQSKQNLGHIAGLCLFHQNIKFDSQSIPPKTRTWFHVADMNSALRTIGAIVSSQINLPDKDIEKVLEQLDVPRYFPDGRPVETEFKISAQADTPSDVTLNTEQMKAFVQTKDWLDNKSCKIFSLQGAYHSGKSKLTQRIVKELLARKKTPIFLAPNGRVANRCKVADIGDINSIYSWLYDKVPSGIIKGKQVYRVNRPELNLAESVIVILDSHLLSDDRFELENTVYGSGHILTDFLESFKPEEQKPQSKKPDISSSYLPKILLVGDPYQLKRSSKHNDLVSCGIFKKRGIEYTITELRSHDRDKSAPIERLDFQKTLVEQINGHRFLNLPKCLGEKMQTITKGEHTDAIADKLLIWPKHATYLCGKNRSAQSVNIAIRKNYLTAHDPNILVKGDIIDLYSPTCPLRKTEDTLQHENQIHPGQFALVVSANTQIENKSIALKGRDEEVVVKFAQARIELEGGSICDIEYLPDFLSSTKPELPKDHGVALGIWAKEEADSFLEFENKDLERLKAENKKNTTEYIEKKRDYDQRHSQLAMESRFTTVARIRYAYAMTAHKAQSYDPLPTIILDGSSAYDTDNPATESYFRFLYTATTCTSDVIQIVDYPKLSPLSKTTWNFEPKRIASITVKQPLFFNKDRLPSNSDNDLLTSYGLSNTDPSLVALLLTVNDLISKSDWKIDSLQQHNYKERYSFISTDAKVSVELNYNGKYEVSIGDGVVIEGGSEHELEVKALLQTEPVFHSQDIEFAYNLFRGHLAEKEWCIISYRETNYRVFAVAEAEVGKVELEIDMPSAASISKRGVVSNVKIKQADSIAVAKQFKADFDCE